MTLLESKLAGPLVYVTVGNSVRLRYHAASSAIRSALKSVRRNCVFDMKQLFKLLYSVSDSVLSGQRRNWGRWQWKRD